MKALCAAVENTVLTSDDVDEIASREVNKQVSMLCIWKLSVSFEFVWMKSFSIKVNVINQFLRINFVRVANDSVKRQVDTISFCQNCALSFLNLILFFLGSTFVIYSKNAAQKSVVCV